MPVVYGSKYQVYTGSADQTRGGLEKKDIIRSEDKWGTVRYRSRKQVKSPNNWVKSYTKAVKEFEKKYGGGFTTIYKPNKAYPGVSKADLEKGRTLYKMAMKIHNKSK